MQNNPLIITSIPQEEKVKIVDTLKKRGVPRACPMCASNQWTISDGFLAPPIQFDLRNMVFGGQSIPSVALICTNCGFMSNHALGVLGLLPNLGSGNKSDAQEGNT